jgi:glyoxylase-like metal-dependent hydrolase (beta-lactamase superfamily II)
MNPILLPAGNPSSWTGRTGNNTYLLPARIPTLVDAGVGAASHLDAIARSLEGRTLALVLVTHGHADHVSGAAAIASRWPGVRIRQFGGGFDPIAPDETIDLGGALLTALHTPGHSPDHCCFLLSNDIFSGDLVRRGGTVVIPASRGGDLAEYLRSLQRIRELRPRRLLPGHGPIVEDPVALIDEYLRHRAEREAQILGALDDGACIVPEVVAAVYASLAEELKGGAAESVTAHLIKLQREARVVENSGRWTRVKW